MKYNILLVPFRITEDLLSLKEKEKSGRSPSRQWSWKMFAFLILVLNAFTQAPFLLNSEKNSHALSAWKKKNANGILSRDGSRFVNYKSWWKKVGNWKCLKYISVIIMNSNSIIFTRFKDHVSATCHLTFLFFTRRNNRKGFLNLCLSHVSKLATQGSDQPGVFLCKRQY